MRTKGFELGVRTQIIPNLESSLALWVLEQDSELLFIGDAGTTEPSRPSRREGIEWLNYYRPLPWLLIDLEPRSRERASTDDDPAGDYIPGALDAWRMTGVTIENLGRWFAILRRATSVRAR